MSDKEDASSQQEMPLWARATDALNAIREDLLSREATIEGEVKRLTEEYNHIQNTLMRITPSTPEAGPPNTLNAVPPGAPMGGQARRW